MLVGRSSKKGVNESDQQINKQITLTITLADKEIPYPEKDIDIGDDIGKGDI